jgi:hypothetical protein
MNIYSHKFHSGEHSFIALHKPNYGDLLHACFKRILMILLTEREKQGTIGAMKGGGV